MSEIGEKAEKIWRKQTEMIRREKELVAAQTEDYANLILGVFGASNEQYRVSTVIVGTDINYLNCCVQFFDIGGKYSKVNNEKIMAAINNVHACKFEDYTILKNIYNVLVADSQVTKYFEVTLDEEGRIVIKMRPEDEVTPNEAICENEEPKE